MTEQSCVKCVVFTECHLYKYRVKVGDIRQNSCDCSNVLLLVLMECKSNIDTSQEGTTGLEIMINKLPSACVPKQREPESFAAECWLSDYADHCLETLRKKEKLRPVISLSSPQIKFRGFLVVELRRIVCSLSLGGRVLHIAVRLLDIFMDAHDIHPDRLLHVAVVCLLIGAKFELKGHRVPRFAEMCDEINVEVIPPELLRILEWKILQHIHWDLCAPTALTFSEFLMSSLVSAEEFDQWCKTHGNLIDLSHERFILYTKSRVKTFLHLTLTDMRLSKVAPSLLAASCIHAARTFQGLYEWSNDLQQLSKYTQQDILPLSSLLIRMITAKYDQLSLKRERSDSIDDQGYDTEKGSPESIRKRRWGDSIDSPDT